MADCSYVRCVQERRFIKRELQKWYKNMVYIVGLERVAEELMGRRKWKQYQDDQSQATELLEKQSPSIEQEINKQQTENNKTGIKTETLEIKEENKLMTTEDVSEKLDNNNLQQDSETKPELDTKEQIKSESRGQRLEPIDWQPQEKCHFCVDGKLLKVNEIGELVVEAGPVQPEAELNKHIIESDDSSSSSDTVQQKNHSHRQYPTAFNTKQLEALLKTIGGNSNNMTSLESMAARFAAMQQLQSVSELNPFLQANLFYQQLSQISPTTTPDRTLSPAIRTPSSIDVPSPSPTNHTTAGEQPLDLSAKPGIGGSIMDSKNIFKAKPRISTVPGRRSYTEEELNNALQDILSGKLGTRRAAVQYGIPRSTLRNKVYKLAIEQKRELLANNPPIAVLEGDDDDKDSGPEDDYGKMNSNDQLQTYLKMFQDNSLKHEPKETKSPGLPQGASSTWPIDPSLWLQSILLAGAGGSGMSGIGNFPSLLQSTSKEELPDVLRKLLTQPMELKNSDSDKTERRNSSGISNGIPNSLDPLMMMNLFQQQNNNKRSSGTPDIEMNDNSDDSSIILKVPSVKLPFGAVGSSSASSSVQSKNGDNSHSTPSTSPQIGHMSSTSPKTIQQSTSGIGGLTIRSPSLLQRQRSQSQSPDKFSIHDVIRQSISKNFLEDPKHSRPLMIDPMDHYRKPSISVIKNLGGTDISSFGRDPNITQMQQSQLSPNTGTGGKGTRPKRGKYRNYDRDSLVEAVKAVQRGEMSVHRAGSYYGVPHSTLEYKVKERHLMRPRKREPKPQPGLDSTSSSSTSTATKTQDLSGLRTMDKSKTMPSAKPQLKPPFSSPNGMKMPPFLDPQMAAQLQYTSQLFWQHPGNFPTMPNLDFTRSSSTSSQNNAPQFPQNAENFFTQQMLQKFQDDQQQQQFKPPVNGNQSNAINKGPRDLDSPYEGLSTNGSSFLDGIIRQSLDKKPGELVHGTLFEHLLKSKNSLPTSSGPSDDDDYPASKAKIKRPGSPLNFTQHPEIKRERSSPTLNDAETNYLMQNQQAITVKSEELNNGSDMKNSDISDVNS